MAINNSITDWISALSSLAAAFIGIVTLLTVYIGAMQLLSQNRMYRIGLSWRSLGPWRLRATQSTLLGLQRRIYTPRVNLKILVKRHWKPNIVFPVGFPRVERTESPEDGDKIQAKASWVNFMQALGLSPDDTDYYEMEDASELVNGIVPMPWTGRDLAGICSILGFQSYEKCPSFKSPMPLPMQWSGPLGWLQFRSSTNGCIAEFRPRMPMQNQIPSDFHRYERCRSSILPQDAGSLESRLWNSISGLSLGDDEALMLGGADKHERPEGVEEEEEEDQEKAVFEELASHDLSLEEIRLKLFGRKQNRPKVLRQNAQDNRRNRSRRLGDDDMPSFFDSGLRDTMESCDLKRVLNPCRGLLSVAVQGELAFNRGLNVQGEGIHEYDCKYMAAEEINHETHPYHLGNLYMGPELLKLMKRALLRLKPDGFYFSPNQHLASDVSAMYDHINEQSNKIKEIFPSSSARVWQQGHHLKGSSLSTSTASNSATSQPRESNPCLYFAMDLCNELQKTKKTARACFTVDDMRLLAQAARAMKDIIGPAEEDLVWAMLYSPRLSQDIRKELKSLSKLSDFLDKKVMAKAGVLDCSSLFQGVEQSSSRQYNIQLLGDGEFTGEQILAALSLVFITYFWIDKAWITDVAAYDATMPQSVLLC